MQSRRRVAWLRRPWLFVVVIAVSSLLSYDVYAAASTQHRVPFTFRFPDLDGQMVDAADLRGKIVLVNIFATWCPPCAKEMPGLQTLADAYRDQGFVVVGIALDRPGLMGLAPNLDMRTHLRRFVADLHVTYPILMADQAITMKDGQMVVEQWGGVSGIPMSYILDRDGMVVHAIIGYRKRAVFEQAVQRLLAH